MQHKIDMGLALLELENWHKVSLDSDFTFVSEKKTLEHALNCPVQENFLEVLDIHSQKILRHVAGSTAADDVGSSILFTPDGAPLQILLVHREKKLDIFFQNIESRLRSLEHLTIFFRHFLTTPTAICFTDKEAHIIDANRSFLDLYGYRLDEVVGKKPNILKSGRQSPSVYGDMWTSITRGPCGNWSGEVINRRKDGEERTVHLTISAVRTNSGSILGFAASSIDITREKRLEEALKARNEELIKVNNLKMVMMSHDLKSSMDSIASRASLIKETIGAISHDRLLEHASRIISDCSRVNAFMNNVLEFEKMESGNFQLRTARIHLHSLLRSSIDANSASALKKAITISFRIEASPQPVLVDGAKMEQVFNAIIANTVHSSPHGSAITVVYDDCPEGKLVEVRTQGLAIPDSAVEGMLLDSYFQGSLPERGLGSGLLLNIARKVVELHGGAIKAESLPGGETVFSVRIPVDRPVVSGSDLAALIHDPSGSVFHSVCGPLSANNVCCFITKSDFEAGRILQYEKPNLVFLEEDSLTPELRRVIFETTEGTRANTEFILVAPEEPAELDQLFNRVVVTPVLGTEVLEILKDSGLTALTGEGATGPYHVFIVGHDETTHDMLGEYLSLAGYRVGHAYDATEGLKLLAAELPDLILLDVQMQEMDSFRLLQAMKNKPVLCDVPVVILTDLETDIDSLNLDEKDFGLEAEDFIAKPLNRGEVLARVRATLRRSARYRKIEGALEGNLADVSLAELLQTLEIGRKSARVKLGGMDGEILVLEGALVSVRQGTFHGEEAFIRLFYLDKGSFTVHFGVHHPEHQGAGIALQSLLMHAAAYTDEVRFLLSTLPSERMVLELAEGAEPSGELAPLSTYLPSPLNDLLVLMKGSLRDNAEQITSAYREGMLKPAMEVR